ncbi:MAG: hypothetical protein WC586_04330 [Methanoregula sp.]
MAKARKVKKPKKIFPAESLPKLVEDALARNEDFILTVETDPDTGSQRIHAMTGKYISACMLRKLLGLAESQQDEGNRILSGDPPSESGRRMKRS